MTTRRTRNERGSVSLYFACLALILLPLGGFLWDASLKISAMRTAQTTAQEAARAGAQALSPSAIEGTISGADPTQAVGAAQSYLSAAGESGAVTVNGDEITVTVSKPWTGQLVLGGGTTTATATSRIAATR